METKCTTAEYDKFTSSFTECQCGCWCWTKAINSKGYGHVFFMGKVRRAHRVSFFLEHGRWPSGMVIHSCDNRSCVNPDHLREGTAKENTQDMMVRGRDKHLEGEDSRVAVLTEPNVRDIRRLKSAGEPVASIAALFQISARHVLNICAFKRWAHLT